MITSDFKNYFHPKEEKTILGEMQKDFETPEGFWVLAVSPIAKMISWAEVFVGTLSSPLRQCKIFEGRVKKIGKILELPDRFDKMVSCLVGLGKSLIKGSFWNIGVKATDAYIETARSISLLASVVELGKDVDFFSLSMQQMQVLDFMGFLGSLSLFLLSLKGIIQYGNELLFKEMGSSESKLAMLKMVKKILTLVSSLLGIVAFTCGGVTNRLIFLSLSTGSLFLSIAATYYKKAYIDT